MRGENWKNRAEWRCLSEAGKGVWYVWTKFFAHMKKWFEICLRKQNMAGELPKDPVDERKVNPYLSKLRPILEQLLLQYDVTYRQFAPLLLDTDMPPQSMLDEDDVAMVLEQISKDLNFLKIATDRPAYFQEYVETMYEETGLVVQLLGKAAIDTEGVNVILDMEQKGSCHERLMRAEIRYISIYKRPWNQGGNLDISVPIGYNTVIVKGI